MWKLNPLVCLIASIETGCVWLDPISLQLKETYILSFPRWAAIQSGQSFNHQNLYDVAGLPHSMALIQTLEPCSHN